MCWVISECKISSKFISSSTHYIISQSLHWQHNLYRKTLHGHSVPKDRYISGLLCLIFLIDLYNGSRFVCFHNLQDKWQLLCFLLLNILWIACPNSLLTLHYAYTCTEEKTTKAKRTTYGTVEMEKDSNRSLKVLRVS